MIKTLQVERNKLLYPIHFVIGWLMHLCWECIIPIVPLRFQNKLRRLESSHSFYNVLGLIIFNAIGGLFVMITNVKIANVLGASMYGLYSYYLAIGEVGQNFVRYGRHKTMTRDLIQFPSKGESLISNTFILGLLNLFFFITIVSLFSYQLGFDIGFTPLLLFIAPCLGSIDFQPVYESIRQISWHSLYLLIQKTLFLFLIWFVVSFGKLTLSYLAITLFISWLLIVVVQYWEIIIQNSLKILNYISFSTIHALYKENLLIAVSCMIGVAFGPFIRLVLKNYVDTEAVGIYSAGMQIFVIGQFLIHQISRVGNPMMAEAGKLDCPKEKRARFCKKYTMIMVVSCLPFFLPMMICPKLITSVLFSTEYVSLERYIPYFGIYLLALSVGVVFTQFLLSIRKDKTYFIIYTVTSLAIVVLAFLLIPDMGVLGAVITLCIPNSIGYISYFLFSLKYL